MARPRRRGLRFLWIAVAGLVGANAVAASALEVNVRDSRGAIVTDAVIFAVPLDRPVPPRGPGATAVIDQVDAEFVPHLSVIRTGTSVSFPNRDNIRHHVYSFSPAKSFELPLYKETPSDPVVFDAPGIVTLGCNIHDWMLAYVHVVDTPHFGLTGENGTVRFEDLPPGRYRVELQHPRVRKDPEPLEIVVAAGTPQSLAFEVRLKPEFRRPRAPRGAGGGYD